MFLATYVFGFFTKSFLVKCSGFFHDNGFELTVFFDTQMLNEINFSTRTFSILLMNILHTRVWNSSKNQNNCRKPHIPFTTQNPDLFVISVAGFTRNNDHCVLPLNLKIKRVLNQSTEGKETLYLAALEKKQICCYSKLKHA